MEDLQVVDTWKDKILGDLKEFSSKKHKPVGMHHLIQEINKLANPDKLLEISFTKFEDRFVKKSFWNDLESSDNKIIKKVLPTVSGIVKRKSRFQDEAKSLIVYLIPVPKFVFKYPLKEIYKYFDKIKQEKYKIDEKLLHALAKYGYWGISEEMNESFLFDDFNRNEIFKAANLGEIAPNGFAVTSKFGPRFFMSYMITNAPLKVQLDRPVNICNEDCKKTARQINFDYIKYYKETFGITKTLFDTIKSIIKDNRFGEYIDFCYNCKLGKEYEINLLVKDPLDYKN